MYFGFDSSVLFSQGFAEVRGIYYMLVRFVVRLGVRSELQVLKVLIKVNVFLQIYMVFLK